MTELDNHLLRLQLRDLAKAERAVEDARRYATRTLGTIIDVEVRRRGITLTALASEIGVSKAHLCDIRYGRRFSQVVADYFTKEGAAHG